jgi:hypothetical protein
MDTFIHDPQATLVYGIEWADWLAEGDSIVSSTWQSDDVGISLGFDELDGTQTRVIVSGGTHKRDYRITNHVVSAQGMEDDRSIILKVRHR